MYQRSEALAVRTGPVGRDGLDGHVGRRVERRHRGLLGRGHDAQAREARRRAHLGARRLPGVVPPDPRLGSGSALVRRQELVLREAHGLLDVEAQRRRIPPHDAVLPGLGAMQAGRHRRRRARHVGRPDQHGVGAEAGTAARRPALGPRLGRIDDRVQPREPAVLPTVPDRGHHQEVARARRRHVEDAGRLLAVAGELVRGVLEELRGRAAGEPHGAEPALGVDPARRLGVRLVGREVGQDHDRELEALGAVHGHDAHALGPLLDDRGVARLAALRLYHKAVDEGAEGDDAAALGAAGEVDEPAHIGERLLARRPDGEPGRRPGGGEQPADRVGDRPAVAAAMEVAEHGERVRNFLELGRQVGGQRPEGVQRPAPLAEGEERRVAEREQRAAQRREDGELVLGTLDRGERIADGLHLLPPMERRPADQQVRQVARLEGAHVGMRHVGAEGAEAPEQQADVACAQRHALGGPLALGHRPAAPADQPLDEGRDRVGQALLDLPLDNGPELAVRRGHGQGDERGLALDAAAEGRERHVAGLAPPVEARGEGGVHRLLDLRHGTEAGGELHERSARVDDPSLHLLVEGDVGAAEAVDRLLRVADDEELPGHRARAPPVVHHRIVGREQHQDLRLERIRVLELVDEEVREAPLELAAHGGFAADQVAGQEQEVEEIEAAGALLELVVGLHDGPELVPELRRQVGARIGDEAVEPDLQRVPLLAQLRLGEPVRRGAEADPRRMPVAHEAHEVRLEAVVVPGAHRLGPRHVVDEPRQLGERLREVVLRVPA